MTYLSIDATPVKRGKHPRHTGTAEAMNRLKYDPESALKLTLLANSVLMVSEFAGLRLERPRFGSSRWMTSYELSPGFQTRWSS